MFISTPLSGAAGRRVGLIGSWGAGGIDVLAHRDQVLRDP